MTRIGDRAIMTRPASRCAGSRHQPPVVLAGEGQRLYRMTVILPCSTRPVDAAGAHHDGMPGMWGPRWSERTGKRFHTRYRLWKPSGCRVTVCDSFATVEPWERCVVLRRRAVVVPERKRPSGDLRPWLGPRHKIMDRPVRLRQNRDPRGAQKTEKKRPDGCRDTRPAMCLVARYQVRVTLAPVTAELQRLLRGAHADAAAARGGAAVLDAVAAAAGVVAAGRFGLRGGGETVQGAVGKCANEFHGLTFPLGSTNWAWQGTTMAVSRPCHAIFYCRCQY